jgi:hypothetical protein
MFQILASKLLYLKSRKTDRGPPMFSRHKLLLLIPAILLIPVLLGMTPLNMAQKIGAGCPFSQGKQTLKCNPCPFHSLVSHDDPTIVNLNLTPLDQGSTPPIDIQALDPDSIHSNLTFNSVPLRC